MGQRDSPFVPLAGGSIPSPGPCRPIRRAERELGPQKGARGATPNSTVRAPRKSATRPSGAARSGRSAKARLANSVGAFRDLPSLETVSVGVSARFRTFRISVQGVSAPERAVLARNRDFPSLDPCSGTRKARKRAVLLASDVARPGKPGIVPSCAAERRQTPARPPRWRQPFENQLPSPGGPFRLEASLPPNPLQTGKPLSERSRLAPCDAQQAFGLGERWQAC